MRLPADAGAELAGRIEEEKHEEKPSAAAGTSDRI
jgi:hypothetical protein